MVERRRQREGQGEGPVWRGKGAGRSMNRSMARAAGYSLPVQDVREIKSQMERMEAAERESRGCTVVRAPEFILLREIIFSFYILL